MKIVCLVLTIMISLTNIVQAQQVFSHSYYNNYGFIVRPGDHEIYGAIICTTDEKGTCSGIETISTNIGLEHRHFCEGEVFEKTYVMEIYKNPAYYEFKKDKNGNFYRKFYLEVSKQFKSFTTKSWGMIENLNYKNYTVYVKIFNLKPKTDFMIETSCVGQ